MGNRGPSDDIIFHVMNNVAIFFGCQIRHHMADIRGIERRGLRRHTAWKICVSYHGNTVFADNLFVSNSEITVSAPLSCKIDHHRSGFHRSDHICKPKLGRITTGDQSCGDHNIHIGGQCAKLFQLFFAKLWAGGRSIASGFGAICLRLFKVQKYKLGAH